MRTHLHLLHSQRRGWASCGQRQKGSDSRCEIRGDDPLLCLDDAALGATLVVEVLGQVVKGMLLLRKGVQLRNR